MSEIKNILFATDFSERTENVLIYVLNIASKLSANVILYNSFTETYDTEGNSYKRKEASDKMKEVINSVSGINPQIKIDSIITSGDFTDHIKSIVEENSIDLVVIGSKEIGLLRSFVTKRKVGTTIEVSPCPVLIVPEYFNFEPLKNIVFLTNYYDSDIEDIVYLDLLARPFGAIINIINVEQHNNIVSKQVASEFEAKIRTKLNKSSNIKFSWIEGTDIERIINQLYTKDNKIDLLSMSTRHRNKYEKMYDKSFTKTVALDTTIPLLTFHIKNIHFENELI